MAGALLLNDQRVRTGAEMAEQEVLEVVREEEVTTEKIMVLASGGWNCTPNLLR